jgi:succinate-acetate transporter protein
MIFGTLWITFLLLGVAYLYTPDGSSAPHEGCQKAGGMFGLLSAFSAWWNALAGLADDSNSFFIVPVLHFPWSEKGRQNRAKKADDLEARKQE